MKLEKTEYRTSLLALVLNLRYIVLAVFVLFLLMGCSLTPDIGDVGTLNAETLESIENLSTTVNTTNISFQMYAWSLGIVALVAWCVRTPWGLVSDFLGMSKARKLAGL